METKANQKSRVWDEDLNDAQNREEEELIFLTIAEKRYGYYCPLEGVPDLPSKKKEI